VKQLRGYADLRGYFFVQKLTVADMDPFTDAELERIYKACDALGGHTAPGPGYRNWVGKT